jgi:hypothetical protein
MQVKYTKVTLIHVVPENRNYHKRKLFVLLDAVQEGYYLDPNAKVVKESRLIESSIAHLSPFWVF